MLGYFYKQLPILQPEIIIEENAGGKTSTLGIYQSIGLEIIAGPLAQVFEPWPLRQLASPCQSLQGVGRHAIERNLKPTFDVSEFEGVAKVVIEEATPKKEVERLPCCSPWPSMNRHRANQSLGSCGEPSAELLLRFDRNVIEFEVTEVTLHRPEDTGPLVPHGADADAINGDELLNH